MAGLLEQDGGQEPPESSDLHHAGSNGKANGTSHTVSAVDAQAGHLKAGAKESPKRKKASKMAKLKQSKLDARREQWLSQVPGKKSPPSRASSNGDFFHQCETEQRDESSAAEESPSSAPKATEAVSIKQQNTQANGHSEATPVHDRNGHHKYSSNKGLPEGEANGVEEGSDLERRRELRRWHTQPPMRRPQEETAVQEDLEKAEVSPSKGGVPKVQKAKKKKGGRQKPGGEGGKIVTAARRTPMTGRQPLKRLGL